MDKRAAILWAMFIDGKPIRDINIFALNEWGVGSAMVSRYLERAEKQAESISARTRSEWVQVQVLAYSRELVLAPNQTTRLRLLDKLDKLLGLTSAARAVKGGAELEEAPQVVSAPVPEVQRGDALEVADAIRRGVADR